jgi:hypothetical protein
LHETEWKIGKEGRGGEKVPMPKKEEKGLAIPLPSPSGTSL